VQNDYYDPGEKRAERVEDLFATIARRYDLINDLQSFGLHRLWKRRLITLAAPRAGTSALDLCCGTGDVALALAARGSRVVGLDFSDPMLTVARRRLAKAQSTRSGPARPGPDLDLHFLRGDAMAIPFPDETFDMVTVSYGLRNLVDWEKGLREMWRVTRRGGRLLVLDFGKPDNAAWRACYFAYLRAGVPLFGRIFCHDSQTHAYIFTSLQHYPAQHGVAAKMRELGCQESSVVPLLGGVMTINYAVKGLESREPPSM
jgi:demethylmenaquinone methyltransferase/2-methoxy-6-polyprenyl-1,4-benzoquinol methylase